MKNLYSCVVFLYQRKLKKIILAMKISGLLSLALSLNLGASVYSENTRFNQNLNEKALKNLQQRVIVGTITDDATGESLPGASISVTGTTRGVVSDMEGKYSIEAAPGEVLLVSFVGYIPEEITVGDQTVIDVALQQGIESLEEIVVVGYGTQKRLEVTGAISSVSSEEINAVPVATADQALQGRAAGVVVVNNGSPGTAPSVRIRGLSTVNQNDPLFVIDGVVAAGLGAINPNDIESIEVLKDASTAAIYGSLGSNGVVLITTKRGTGEKVRIDFDSYWGTQWNNNRYDLLNTEQYIQYASSSDVTTTPPVITDPQYASRLQGETDWQDEVYQSGFMQKYDLVASGGGKNSNYRISGGYISQDGIIRTTDYERYNFRANSDFGLGRLRIGENLAVAFTNQTPLPDAGGRSILEHAIKMAPYLPVYNPDNLGGFQGPSSPIDGQDAENPVRVLELFDYSVKTRSIIGNIYGELELVNGLKFKSLAGLENINLYDDQFYPQYNDDNLGSSTHARATALTRKNSATYTSLIFTNSLTYSKSFADAHNLEVLALVESSRIDNAITNASSENAITSEVQQLGNTSSNLKSESQEYDRIGYLGRINYNYKQKYLLAASYRADASSRFGANNRWGYFPSVAAGWRINKEAFMDNVEIISNLKIRGSWGIAGNDKIGNYQYATTLTSNMYYVINNGAAAGTTVSGAANPDLKWEETTMTNIGLDLGLLSNQFTLSAEYYINRSDDLLMALTTAPSLGIFSGSKSANVGSVETKGIDLQLGYNDFEGELQWSAQLNLGTFKNEVKSLGGLKSVTQSQFENEGITRLEVGEPLFYFYGWQFDGIFQSDAEATSYMGGTQAANFAARGGDFRIVDVAGPADADGNPTGPDGEITADDRTNIGNPFPDLTLGFNLDAYYKGFDLNLFVQGVYGNDVYNTNIYDLEGMPRLFNSGVAVLDRWTPTNPSNTVPRPGVGTNVQVSSRFVEDGSYTRLKNLTLGYTLPADIIGKAIAKVRIYVSAQNLITLTKYSGLDPEVGANTVVQADVTYIGQPRKYGSGYPVNNFQNGIDYGAYPIPKSFIAGIQLTF
jgi:TonB-linked SusC/RagA family outer membrane protein